MKVSYRGRVRVFNEFPKSMNEFRATVQSKFIRCQLIPPGEDETKLMASALEEQDNEKYADLINQNILEREAEKKQKKPKVQNIIDFKKEKVFYEDSEGDMNVISDDEDLINASRYVSQHRNKKLKCSIISSEFYEQVREE